MDMTTPDKSPISNKIKKYVNQIARLADGDVRKQLFNLVGLIENQVALEEAEYGELKQSPRELLERTWKAAIDWQLDIYNKQNFPDKKTFINSILSESPKEG